MAIDWEAYKKKAKQRDEYDYQKNIANNDIAPVRTTTTSKDDDIGPVKTTKKKDDRTWFQKSKYFADGKWDKGDLIKTILGSATDVAEDLGTGIVGMGETALDTLATIAPYLAQAQFSQSGGYYNTEATKGFNAMQEEAKKGFSQFVEKDLYDEEKIAKKIISAPIKDATGVDVETSSVFGEKTDSLAQSGGQLLATAGLQAVGVPWFLTTGATSFGSQAETALKEGATYEEATASGLISAGAEILTEKLSGGISFGGKTLDDVVLNQITQKISNKVVKSLVKIGLDATGEGAEEVVSGVLSNLGTALYKEEDVTELLFSEEAIDGYIESFIGGAALGGFSSAINEARSKNALTENEQKVVDKVVENRIAEKEVDGKTLSKAEKSSIQKQVINDLVKGYIDIDTIESALGGEAYKSYKDTLDNETALKEEFDTLNKMKQGDMTGEQIDKRAELKQQLEELKNTSKKTELKDKLSNDVFNLVKDSRLAESYNERARRGQSFEADLSKYDTKQQEVIKKAVESGILNNTNRTHEFVDMIAKISADKGVLFDFTNNEKLKNSGFAVEGKTVNGYKTDDGNIALNIQSHKVLESVVGHEITHILEGTELYSALQEAVKQYATTKGEYVARMQSLRELYTGVYKGTDFDTKLQAELTADIVGDYLFSDSDFINSLSTEQPNLFKKIYNEIKYLCKVATAGSKEARELEKVKKAFDNAWKESGTAQKNTTNKGDVKYLLSETTDGRIVAVVDNDILENIDTTSWDNTKKETAKKAASNALKQFNDGIVVDGITRKVNRRSRREYTRSDYTESLYNKTPDVFADKMRAADVADDIVVATTNWNRDGGLKHPRDDNFVDFDHGTTLIATKTAKYSAEVVVGITDNGEAVLYDVVDMKPTTFDIKKEESPTTATTQNAIGDIKGDSSTTILPQNSEKSSGKNDFPLSDSDGRELSTEQSEYFKESKIRDADGNLKVMYHGSPETFTVFDRKKARSGGTYGSGFYFTDSKSHAGTYGDSYVVYLNITNPLQNGTNNITKEQLRKFVEEIAKNEDYGIENYGYGATIDSVVDNVYGKSDFGMLMDLNISCIGDMVEAVKLFNEVNGTDYDGIVAPTETVAFHSEQIKDIDNKTPTENPDIHLSLSKEGEQSSKDGRFYGKDMLLENSGDLPIREDVAKNTTTTFDDIAPIREDEANAMREEQDNIAPFTDADVPPEFDAPMYDVADTTKIDDTVLKGIGQRLRETLSLTTKETKAIQEVVQQYSTTEIPNNEQLFNEIKEKFSEKTWKERNEEIAEIKLILKGFKIKVSDNIKNDIADYGDWQKHNWGKLNFSKDGLTVDDIYESLSISYPGFFPSDVVNPTDQLLLLSEVAGMDTYATGTHQLDDDIIQQATDIVISEVNKYKENELAQQMAEEQSHFYRGLVEEETAEDSTAKTVKERIADEVKNARAELLMNQQLRYESRTDYEKEISRLQAVYNGKRDKNTKVANNILRRIERLQRMKNDVDADYSKRISDIENRIAKLESKDYATVEQRKTKQQELRTQMENLVGDTSTWVDKKLGISYKVNTLRRNLRDIVRDENGKRDIAKADAIYDELQGKYNHNEAELNREANRIKQQFAKMKITSAEDTYIQMLGELRHNPETTLTEDVVKDFFNKHKKNIDEAKVDKAIEMARPLYDELLSRVNQVLSEQGMKEIPYRKGYFPHFTEDKQGFLAKLFNWKTKNNDIPTDIAGLTENFKPERSWQSFNKQRKTDTTDYSFLKGLDSYIQGSLDWIYHIEDIQKRRALENHIRYVHSEQGIKDKIDAIHNDEKYDADEMQEQIELVYKEAGNPLHNFVQDLQAGTNALASKKSPMDRGMEQLTNRQVYSVMTNISNRVSANMVGGSISSALTNFIPITQSWGQVSPISSLRAMGDTIRSTFRDDGTIDKSDFLTNRLRKSENLYKTGWDKANDVFGILMECVDSFTSQTVWRSKYLENISKGMSENAAIKDADQFAENILAGRSRGNNPTIFDSKNPFIKTFTVFQLEVANQYGYMFKDMPQDMANESKAKLVKGYITMFLGAYAYNALYSSLVGRDAAFDPIGIIEDLLRDLGFGGDDEEEEEIAPTDAILNLTNNVLEELPFVGGLLGGGRIPLSSALPYGGIKEAYEGTLTDLEEGNKLALTREWLNPIFYLAMPMGGGQLKKSWQGLKMFDDDLPIAGSYTDSGNLRFPVEDTPLNRVQAGLFGQYANKNARKYFDDDIAPLNEKQIKEYADLDLPIADYWKYRERLKDFEKQDEKVAYINGLDVTEEQKNTLKSYLYDEEGYKEENPEKYAFLEKEGIGFLGYKEADDETQNAWSWAFKHQDEYRYLKENGVNPEDYSVYYSPRVEFDDEGDRAYEWAFDNPEKATIGKVFSNGVKEYRQYTNDLSSIHAGNDTKRQKKAYIWGLDIDYGAKCILFKSIYDKDDTYNKAIVDYINSRDDITTEEKRTILEELGATIDSNGYIHW